jgi:acetyl-CoA acetyltransferase
MARTLSDLRPVYVVGAGWHRYQNPSEAPYVTLGLAAIREALADARIEWPAVESTYVATPLLGMAAGRPTLRQLGTTGAPLLHIENASASGSTAFRHACIEVASGISDVALAVGVDKRNPVRRSETGIDPLADDAIVPFTHFALFTNEYISRYNASIEDIALVAVKNHRNGAKNPNAQRQQERSLEEILGGKKVSGSLTSLQRTPIGEGAAAVIVASDEGIRRYGIDPGRAIRVTASVGRSERVYPPGVGFDAALTRRDRRTRIGASEAAPYRSRHHRTSRCLHGRRASLHRKHWLMSGGTWSWHAERWRSGYRRRMRGQSVGRTDCDGTSNRAHWSWSDWRDHQAAQRRGWQTATSPRPRGVGAHGGRWRSL